MPYFHRWKHWRSRLPALLLAPRGWFGTLATFGFIYAYLATSAAAASYLRRLQCLTAAKIVVVAVSLLILAFSILGSLYPIPAAPYNYLPFVFVAYMLSGFFWQSSAGKGK